METLPYSPPDQDVLAVLPPSDALARAHAEAVRLRVPLAEQLAAEGAVGQEELDRLLAGHWEVPYITLRESTADPVLVNAQPAARLWREGWIPLWRSADGGAVRVGFVGRPDQERVQQVAQVVGAPVEAAVVSQDAFREALLRCHREELVELAVSGLALRAPLQSAQRVLTRAQQLLAAGLVVLIVLGFLADWRSALATVFAVVNVAFLFSVGFKFLVCMRGAEREREEPISAADLDALDEGSLPGFTVLVPVYREAGIVGQLLLNLGELDWPRAKLEVLVLLEEDDSETVAAARAAQPPAWMKLVVVPQCEPRTKPKACNVGLFFARGDYLVIYDAEDQPDPDQLKKAHLAFTRADGDTVCVQAALNYWNAEENALTRMFTLEYSFWFDYMLPGLDDLRLPIPLGGTSNHFRTDALRRLGGWDPFNVTEDADLGVRAAAEGWRVSVVGSTTYEEANRAYGNWIRQRSRWVKGYLQTLLVHLRAPVRLTRTIGLGQTLAFVLLIGGTPAGFLAAPPLLLLFVCSLLVPTNRLIEVLPAWLLAVSMIDLVIGNTAMIYVGMMGAFRRRRYRLVPWALLTPLYWLLHCAAAYKALWQLITRPHYWEKTTHGLSTVSHPGQGPDLVPGPQPAVGLDRG
ncbi:MULTISPECIES: glycosyltransferase [Streptacidiphilus]|uniref:Glycosyltransferase n=1 Tax=Streptacidiphilus cavernicola TaxID=3342716 RepID=A0ABV6UM54_9ACTN|nr:glycosyltransferase [Streptacidiphilus jeojiense]